MKKKHANQYLILLILSLIFTTTSLAQNGNGNGNGNGQLNNQWKITGNVADTNNFIGTTNLRDIKFKTNSIEHLRLTKEGDLGLGTSTPASKLDVYGNVILRNLLQLPNTPSTSSLANKYFLIVDSLGNVNKTPVTNYPGWNPILTKCDLVNANGTMGILNPYWGSELNKLYSECPSVFVGIATATPRVNLDVIGKIYGNALSIGSDPLLNTARFHLKADLIPTSVVKMMLVESTQQELLSLNYQGLLTTRNIFIKIEDNSTPLIIQNSLEKILQLDNNGLLHARKIKVDTQTWPDYVFSDKYSLMPLLEVEKFIQTEKHLPNIPSENEMVLNGIDLSEMNILLMEKIEELVLYSIDQQKQINQLIYQVKELEKTTENR